MLVLYKRFQIINLPAYADDDDDETKKEKTMSPEEIRAKQKRDREEKQRRYDEARAKIFGESAPSSRGSSPGAGTTTPPRTDGRSPQQGRGRGRGGQIYRGSTTPATISLTENRSLEPRRPPGQSRELFDPNYSPKHDNGYQGFSRQAIKEEQVPVRAPRGPDGSGRGGFGFARHGS